MRPAYLSTLEMVLLPAGSLGWKRRNVEVEGVPVGWIERVQSGPFLYWRINGQAKAYASALDAAESLAVLVMDGPVAMATFEGERMKENAS